MLAFILPMCNGICLSLIGQWGFKGAMQPPQLPRLLGGQSVIRVTELVGCRVVHCYWLFCGSSPVN